MAVKRNERRVLIVSELPTFGKKNLKWLYSFLDASGVAIGVSTLAPFYKEVRALTGAKATKAKFVSTLCSMSRKPGTKAVDVIVNLHGAKDRLWFRDGSVKTEKLAEEIQPAIAMRQSALSISPPV